MPFKNILAKANIEGDARISQIVKTLCIGVILTLQPLVSLAETPPKDLSAGHASLDGLSMDSAQQELQTIRQSIQNLQTAQTLLDERIAEIERQKAARYYGSPTPEEDIKNLIDQIHSSEQSNPSAIDLNSIRSTAFTLARELGASSFSPPPSDLLSIESHEEDSAELKQAKALLRNQVKSLESQIPNAQNQSPAWKSPQLSQFGLLVDKISDSSDLQTVKQLPIAYSGLGSNGLSDLTERIRAIEQYEQNNRMAAVTNALERAKRIRVNLAADITAATDRQHLLEEHVRKLKERNQEIITSNLLYLLIGMMVVIVVMVLVVAAISNRPIAITIIEQRTLIELAGVTFLLSVVLLLASAAKIEAATTGTLLGTIAGYILSRRSSSNPQTRRNSSDERLG